MLAAAAGLAEVFGDEVEDVGQSSEDDHVSKVGDGNTEHGGRIFLETSWPSMKKPAQMKMAAAMSSTVTAGAGFGLDFQRLVLDAEQLAVAGHLRKRGQ